MAEARATGKDAKAVSVARRARGGVPVSRGATTNAEAAGWAATQRTALTEDAAAPGADQTTGRRCYQAGVFDRERDQTSPSPVGEGSESHPPDSQRDHIARGFFLPEVRQVHEDTAAGRHH